MKFLILALLALAGAVATTRLVSQDPGHVLLSYGGYTVETSLAVTVAVVLIGFVAVYALLRLVVWGYRTPRRWRLWRQQRHGHGARAARHRGHARETPRPERTERLASARRGHPRARQRAR